MLKTPGSKLVRDCGLKAGKMVRTHLHYCLFTI